MEKVLIISYFFKPCNLTASNRTSYWAENFYKFNLYPIVVTRKWEKEISILEDSSISTSTGVHIDKNDKRSIYFLPFIGNLRDRIINKYGVKRFIIVRKFLSLLNLIFQNFFISFLPYASFYYFARKLLIEDKEIKKIITSGNPFQQFFICYLLKKEFDYIEWIADYRDEWTTHPQNNKIGKPKLIVLLEKRSEKLWTSNASCITFVNNYQINNISRFVNKKAYTISNGYESDIIPISDINNNTLVLTYTGTLYSYQNILPFADALRKLKNEIKDLNLIINFIGVELLEGTKDRILKEFIGLEVFLNITKRIPFEDTKKIMSGSDIFMVFQGINNIVDSKVYDYLPFHKPILACTDKNELLISLLNETGIGIVAVDSEDLYLKLKALYLKKSKNLALLDNINVDEVKKYSREVQTATLAGIIKEL